jgi:tRNA pseudouridine55 synthase
VSLATDGVLVVDKPAGPTSHDVVAVARRALGTPKVGHTGTLDPMATGVLVLVVGRATRLARYLAGDVKSYDAQVTFGRTTDTYDALGTTTLETGERPEEAAVVAALAGFTGPFEQRPPAYSAKKVGGETAYKLARRDLPVALAPVAVVVHALTLGHYADGVATVTVRASAGFYVRSLAHDLGEALGTGAHLSALRRTEAGAFALAEAVSWEVLARGGEGARAGLQPIDRLLPELPGVVLSSDDVARARHGQTVQSFLPPEVLAGPVRLLDGAARLIGIAEATRGDSARLTQASVNAPVTLQPVVILG